MKTLIAPRAGKGIDQAAEAEVPLYRGGGYAVESVGTPWAGSSWGAFGVDPAFAYNIMTVYQCVSALANAFAQLPLVLYRRRGDDREKADDHPLYRTFHDAPNPAMSSFAWRRILMGHMATWGNAYNEIREVSGGIELWPIRPDRIEVVWAAGGTRRDYYYLSPTGARTLLRPGSVFHLQALSSSGLVGLSPIAAMRRGIGLYRKAEQYGEAVFDNGARPAIVLKHPKVLSEGAIERLGAQMDALRGSGNAGKSVILEEGLDVHEIGFPPEDAQFMETRLFQKREIVTGFGLPLGMSGDPDFADESEDELTRKLIKLTMAPHFVNFQQEASLQVIDDTDLYVEFKIDGFLWGDPKARADALAVQWEHGNLNNDEWRAIENMSPLPDGLGQTYYRPANWVAVELEPEPEPVGGDASVPSQFGAEPVDEPPVAGEGFGQTAELVDQLTRAKAVRCPACDKLLIPELVGSVKMTCSRCKAEVAA